MKKIIALMLVLGFVSVTGCSSTLEGMGKDIEAMGKSIQKNTDSE